MDAAEHRTETLDDDADPPDGDADPPLAAVVLAGGTGTRLYPASRADRPKQFLELLDGGSLYVRTLERASFADRRFVVTRSAFADEARERAREAGFAPEIVVEPGARDTGPALAYATARVRERLAHPDPVVLALPSDHHVPSDDADEFASTLRRGARVAAATDRLVTFGVEPTRPATGYGYVEPGPEQRTDDGIAYRAVAGFHEKPDRETAEAYLAAGHRWNAGIFAWTPSAFRREARDSPIAPLVDLLWEGGTGGGSDADRVAAAFDRIDPISVDRAVLERAECRALVPAGFEWDDLGTWDGIDRVLPTDGAGNAVRGEALALDARDNVVATDDKHVSLVGVDGLAVIAWDDRVLVVPKEQADRVREVVERLRSTGRF